MAAPKRATHQVVKSGLYFTSGEKEMEVGTQLTLTKTQAGKLEARGFVKPIKDMKSVDVSDADSKALEQAQTDLKAKDEALKKAEADLKVKDEALKKAEADLKAASK